MADVKAKERRTTLVRLIFGSGLTFAGLVAGGPLGALGVGALEPLVNAFAGGVGSNLLASLAEEKLQESLTVKGTLNHDIAKALCDAFQKAIDQLLEDWEKYPQEAAKNPDAKYVKNELERLKKEGSIIFQQPEELDRALKGENIQELLQHNTANQPQLAAQQLLVSTLRTHLGAFDRPLVEFVEQQLFNLWPFHFVEILKSDEGTRAWRACQLLWQQSIQAALAETSRHTGATSEDVKELRQWLEAWQQRWEVDQRDPTGLAELEAALPLLQQQMATVAQGVERIEKGVAGITLQLTGLESNLATKIEELKNLLSTLLPSAPAPTFTIQGNVALAAPQPHHPMLRERQAHYLENHRLFGGRDAELEKMREFIQTRQQGYIFVTGPWGYGKTALLANFITQYPNRDHLCWYFLNQLENTHRRRDFLRQMGEQLLAYYQLPLQSEADLPFEEDRLEALYAKLLRMPLVQTEQPLVLVIDGVDEAELNPSQKPFINKEYIPSCRLPGKFIIFSVRDTMQDELAAALRLPPAEVLTIRLQSLDLAGIKALLQVAGGPATGWANDEQLLAQLHRVSEGDPFYLHYLVEDIMDGKLTPAQIEHKPTGLESYLDDWWEQVSNESYVRKILWTLMVTRGPLPHKDFFQLYPKLEWRFKKVLAPIRRFVFVIESSDSKPAYTLCHPRIQTHLTNEFEGQVAKYRTKLLKHCARWQEHQSKYALRFYAQHLAEAQQWEPLYTLAREPTFGPAQLKAYPNNPDLPLETLQLALDGATTTDNAGAMAEFLLAHARKLIDVAEENPLEALRQVSLERACKLAALYEPERRILWYLLLAWDLHHQGRDEEARALLAKQAGERQPQLGGMFVMFRNTWQAKLAATLLCDLFAVNHIASKTLAQLLLDGERLAELSDQLVAQGYIKAALEIAQAIDLRWRFRRAEALSSIATAQAQAGDFPAALQTAQAIESEGIRANALTAIAKAQVQAGDISAAATTLSLALQATQAIDFELKRAALDDIATVQAQAGDIPAALQTAQAIEDNGWQWQRWQPWQRPPTALSAITTAQAQTGNISVAFQTAQAIKDKSERANALSAIAIVQAQAGDTEASATFNLARQIAQEIEDKEERAWDLSAIAIAQAQAGDIFEASATFNLALQTAQAIEDEKSRIEFLVTLATAQAQAGLNASTTFKLALQTAQAIDDEWQRADALRDISVAQAQAGYFHAALQTTQKIERIDKWADALRDIAIAQAQAGDFPAALQTAQKIEDKRERAEALSSIAKAQAQAGNINAASATFTLILQTAQAIDDEMERAQAFTLRDIAAVQAQAGDINAALQTAQAIKDEWLWARALNSISVALPQVGDITAAAAALSLALQTAQATEREWAASALCSIAKIQAKLGNISAASETFTLARQIAQVIEYEIHREQALSNIAKAQAQAGDITAALQTAQAIKDERQRAEVLNSISVAQPQVGDITAALQTVQSIKDERMRAIALRAIAQAQAQAGDFPNALQTAQAIEDEWTQAEALRAIAQAQAQAGDFPNALQTAQAIESKWQRAEALEDIATAQAQAEDIPAAMATFNLALQTAQAIEDEWRRTKALSAIAKSQAQAGYFHAAFQTAQEIDNEWQRANVLRDIAVAQAQAGNTTAAATTFNLALQTAQEIEFEELRANALRDIAVAQVQAGYFHAAVATFNLALQTAQAIENEWKRDEDLSAIATAQAQAGNITAALQTAPAIKDEYKRAKALRAIAKAQVQAGDFPNARQTAQAIEFEELRFARQTGQKIDSKWELALFQAEIGDGQGAVETAELNLTERNTRLPEIAEALFKAGDLPNFKRLLRPCAFYLDAAYTMCGLLAQAYPAQAAAVAKVVNDGRLR